MSRVMLAALAATLIIGCASAPQAPRQPCPRCAAPPVPPTEVSADQVQAILTDGGLEVRQLGGVDEERPGLLVIRGDPKVVISVNTRRSDVEMAVVYSTQRSVDLELLKRLNELNQKLPCQASVTPDGRVLLESYYPYDKGLNAEGFVGAVRKFRSYGRGCAMAMRDVLE